MKFELLIIIHVKFQAVIYCLEGSWQGFSFQFYEIIFHLRNQNIVLKRYFILQ